MKGKYLIIRLIDELVLTQSKMLIATKIQLEL